MRWKCLKNLTWVRPAGTCTCVIVYHTTKCVCFSWHCFKKIRLVLTFCYFFVLKSVINWIDIQRNSFAVKMYGILTCLMISKIFFSLFRTWWNLHWWHSIKVVHFTKLIVKSTIIKPWFTSFWILVFFLLTLILLLSLPSDIMERILPSVCLSIFK